MKFLFDLSNGGLQLLTFLVVMDFITGIIKAILEKKINSKVGHQGILKKFLMFSIVAISHRLQIYLGDEVAIESLVIIFYIATEGFSIFENVGNYIPLPRRLKNVFEQLKKQDEEGENEDENHQND